MKKIVQRFISSILIIVLVLIIPSFYVSAEKYNDDNEIFRYLFIKSINAEITLSGSNTLHYSASISCNSYVSSCSITATLQKRLIGTSSWTDVESVSNSGIRGCSAEDTATGYTGYEYRAKGYGVATSSYSPNYEYEYAYSTIITL